MGLRAQLFQRIPPLLALFCAAALVSIGMGFYYRKATWKRHRPAAVHVGPELVTCETVRKRRFYLYDMAVSNRCKRSAALLDAVLQAPMERQQMMGPELFLRQQLEEHPWRTRDPEEADLFILPSLLSLGTSGLCTGSFEELVEAMTLEILSSPYYQRREGRNHLLVVVDWRALKLVLYHDRQQRYPMEEQLERLGETFKLTHYTPAAPAIFGAFRNVSRHFVLAQKHASTFLSHGSLISPYQRTAKVVTVPHLAPSSVQGCTFREGRVVCNQAYTGEANFDSYRRSRNYSLFFLGNTERHEVPGSRKCSHSGEDCMRQLLEQRKLLRPLVVFELGGLGARNVLASSKAPQGLPPKRACSFDGPQQVTTECVCPPLEPSRVSKLLHLSEFAVHVQGDDASSSRVYEAIASGTPQLFLAGRYFGDIAPFKCRVDWGRMVYWLETDEFRANPEGTMRGVLRGFREDPSEWQRLWEAQREAANDLLWHMPQSRVAQNVVEDALRAIDAPPPPAEPPAQPAADRV